MTADLKKKEEEIRKKTEKIRSLEESLERRIRQADEAQEGEKILRAQLEIRQAEVHRLQIAANVSGGAAFVSGIGLLIALLMLL
jgi:hypothetical protein